MDQKSAAVRSHVGLALLDDLRAEGEDPAAEVRRALSRGSRIVVLHALDTLEGADRDQVAAVLRDAASRKPPLTVVATARRDGPALALLADAHRPDVTALALGRRSSISASPTEVTA